MTRPGRPTARTARCSRSRGRFDVGTAFSAATPGNANNAPPHPAPNFLATLDLNTGAVTPVPGITFQAKGLVFVPGEGEDEALPPRGGRDQEGPLWQCAAPGSQAG